MEIELASFGRAALFLGVPFILLIFIFQWKWSNDCQKYIRVLVVQQAGGGMFKMAPKASNAISIKNPLTGAVKMWPISDLATIEVPYPGVGFIPGFLQKTIRMAIVSEGDWEPLLNRSAHLRKVASPDVIEVLTELLKHEKIPDDMRSTLEALLEGISISPTREMIASPAVLGNLIHEKISELAMTVAKDVLNPLNDAIRRLGDKVSPTITYIGLALIIIMLGYLVFQNQELQKLADDINLIKQSIGVR